MFLEINDVEVVVADNDEIYDLVIRVASSQVEVAAVAASLRHVIGE